MQPLDYKATEIRSLGALTVSYVPATVIGINSNTTQQLFSDNQSLLYIDINNLGNMTSVEFKIEFSDDNSNWYQESLATITGGVEINTLLEHQVTTVGKYRIATELKDRYLRISFKGTGGTGTGSLVSCIAIYGTS